MKTKSKRRKPRMIAPCECRNFNEVADLKTDHFDLLDFWIATDGSEVNIYKQQNGKPAAASIDMSIGTFNKLIAWWQKKQKVRK